jgi:hypothetical protein
MDILDDPRIKAALEAFLEGSRHISDPLITMLAIVAEAVRRSLVEEKDERRRRRYARWLRRQAQKFPPGKGASGRAFLLTLATRRPGARPSQL